MSEEYYLSYRKSCLEEKGEPGIYYYDDGDEKNSILLIPRESVCKYNHNSTVCRCNRKIIKIGQDEKIWYWKCTKSKCWMMDGFKKMLPKSKGTGIMTSTFVDGFRGLGIPLSEDELKKVNEYRKTNNKSELKDSPGLIFFDYGKNKQGYWDNVNMCDQVDCVIDVFKIIYPTYQLLFEFDHSSNHLKFDGDSLNSSGMNVNWGGNQRKLRSSLITSLACLGDPAVAQLKVGDYHDSTFTDSTRGPHFPNPYFKKNKATGQHEIIAEDWLHQPKGLKQYLWERVQHREYD